MLETLHSLVETESIVSDSSRFALHEVAPRTVIEPRTAHEAAVVLRAASEHGWRVELAGSASQSFGNRRTRADLVISTRRMTEVAEYEPADLVIGVQAGMPFQKLQRETRNNAQFVAQDPAIHDRSTVGALIATSRSGPLRYAHGTMRDHVLGLQVVTGDGRVLQLGGRVVKNVAGYDLVRLLVGSAGTLGLITAAHLRLKPIPQADETVIATAGAAQPLLEVAEFIKETHLEAQAIELVGADADEWQLLVRLGGNDESVADARARVQARCAHLSVSLQQSSNEAWNGLVRAELGAITEVRIADVPSRMEATLAAAQKIAARVGAGARIHAHAADGIARVFAGESAVEDTAFVIGEMRALLAVTGGTVLVHSRTAELMRRVDAFGATGPQLQIMANLKKIFDPAGILAPGRFVV
jgi:glycolate oxidase FAD binding subunit